MITDALVNFLPIGSNLSFASVATGQSVQSNVVDLLNTGPGTAPQNIIGNVNTAGAFNTDMGIGGQRPQLNVTIGTAAVTGNAATLNVQFQGAPDTGTAGGYLPGTWQTLVETGGLTAAQLAGYSSSNTGVIARFDWPPAVPAQTLSRFLRLNFVTLTATNFTAGTIASALVTMVRDDLANKYAANNYNV